jgi:hypothetical protein
LGNTLVDAGTSDFCVQRTETMLARFGGWILLFAKPRPVWRAAPMARSVSSLTSDSRDQPAARTGKARHDGADRNFSRLGDFAIIEALDIAKH